MDLLTLVRRRLIIPQLDATTKYDAIQQLVDFLVEEDEVPSSSQKTVLEAVLNREAEKPTGLGDGLALPHGVVDLLDREVAALGMSQGGIDFGALDGKPARVILLLVTPRSLAYRHPTNVQNIVVTLCRAESRQAISGCETIEEVVSQLSEAAQ